MNIGLLKRAIIRYYSEDADKQPDMQLVGRHLIRAEHGIHEKTGVKKHLIREIIGYPRINKVRSDIWQRYIKEQEKSISTRMTKELTDHPLVKFLLNTIKMRELGDGRERTLWVLAQILKSKYSKSDLVKLLVEWYHYSGGNKLNEYEVECKVKHHFHKDYVITERYLIDLLTELGVDSKTIEEANSKQKED